MVTIRKAAVAGGFYPADPNVLRETLQHFLYQVTNDLPIPKAIIAPHAGYIYSGPVAASAYACLAKAQGKIKRVVLLGPSHFYPLSGLAAPEADYFETPFGTIPIDRDAIKNLLHFPQMRIIEEAHIREHSLEVHLPFLQYLLKNFTLVPLVASHTDDEDVAEILETLWGNQETLIVISSDLSHYHPYETAQKMDKKTTKAILALNAKAIGLEDACGRAAIRGLLTIARKKKLKVTLIDLRNSADTAGGSGSQVVGYGSFHFYKENT